jgi:long-chain acyl-CoA synthetase
LESLYRTCNLVQNILVYADQQKSKPVAIVLPAEPALKAFAKEKGIGKPDEDLEELVHDRKLEAAVLQELLAAGKRGGLGGIELIAGVVLVPEEWTPQNVLFLLGYINVRAWSPRPRS